MIMTGRDFAARLSAELAHGYILALTGKGALCGFGEAEANLDCGRAFTPPSGLGG